MKRAGLILCVLAAFAVTVHAQPDWKLKRDEDGIKVYTADVEGSAFKTIKVECTIDATLPQIVAFLLDVDKQHEWVFNTATSKLLKVVKPNEIIFYAQVNVPWPGTDRDYISHLVITQKSPQLTVMDSHAEPDGLPEKDGYIRIKKSEAHWEISPVSKGVQKIIYTMQFNPAGSVPAWLTNMFVAKGPYQTFQGLRKGVKGSQYQNAHVDFIKE